jgi:hypothetical protein
LRQDDALRARGGESIIGVSLSFADGFSTRRLTIMQISNRLILGVVAATLPLTAPCAINQADNEGDRCSSVRRS